MDPAGPAFIDDDLRFRQLVKRRQPATQAVVFFAMDVSSSMRERDRQKQGWIQPVDKDFGDQPVRTKLVGKFELSNPTDKDQKISRPRQWYAGPEARDYVPMSGRG